MSDVHCGFRRQQWGISSYVFWQWEGGTCYTHAASLLPASKVSNSCGRSVSQNLLNSSGFWATLENRDSMGLNKVKLTGAFGRIKVACNCNLVSLLISGTANDPPAPAPINILGDLNASHGGTIAPFKRGVGCRRFKLNRWVVWYLGEILMASWDISRRENPFI